MISKRQAIKNFLTNLYEGSDLIDLAQLYNENMEVQVTVAQDQGEKIEGEYRGRKWVGWYDGLETWKPFRIPWKSSSEPHYEDSDMTFDLTKHAEGIGMTGWDWVNKKSIFVAYDFDSLIGHKKGLTDEDLSEIVNKLYDIPYTTIRKSTSGKGIHIYVFLEDSPEVKNHNEHAAIARAILGQLSAASGIDLQSKVDSLGGNMWVWHRKMMQPWFFDPSIDDTSIDDTSIDDPSIEQKSVIKEDCLRLIKQGTKLTHIPPNWRDHFEVVTNKRKYLNLSADVEKVVSQGNKVPLDDGHLQLIKYLENKGAQAWWDHDHHMLVAHTFELFQAHRDLNLRGIFETVAQGKDQGTDHNCFLFPMDNGGWVVRRYTKGVQETRAWDQDPNGWTRTYLNREPTLEIAARYYGGVEHPKGGWMFHKSEKAEAVAKMLGSEVKIPKFISERETKIKKHSDGRLILEVKKEHGDQNIPAEKVDLGDWIFDGGWKKILEAYDKTESKHNAYDGVIRHLISESNEDCGWVINNNGEWVTEPLTHIKLALQADNLKQQEVNVIIGNSIMNCWKLVTRPFEPEYLGDRVWNRNSPQLKFLPKENKDELNFPTWKNIINHVGRNLDPAVKENKWCLDNGITMGSEYLKCWIASMFQFPREPLPYLFIYGDQNTGKSTLHEALSFLMTRGYVNAKDSLKNVHGFNGELENSVLCVVEEVDLRTNKEAYNRIKEWVTSIELPIHMKYKTPYSVQNTTHWIQCSNDLNNCPIFPGDTRITVVRVNKLPTIVGKGTLMEQLKKEAQDFITEIMNIEIPRCNDRLRVPVLDTQEKKIAQSRNETELETFLRTEAYDCPGSLMKFSDFVDQFHNWLDSSERHNWPRNRISREMPEKFPKGKANKDYPEFGVSVRDVVIGNIAFSDLKYEGEFVVYNQYVKLKD